MEERLQNALRRRDLRRQEYWKTRRKLARKVRKVFQILIGGAALLALIGLDITFLDGDVTPIFLFALLCVERMFTSDDWVLTLLQGGHTNEV